MRLIDGDALADRLNNLAYDDWNQGVSTTWANAFAECADMVDDMPTVDAVPVKHGHWINSPINVECSVCGWYGHSNGDDYCSHCGAKMDEEVTVTE